jgi:hypothetical protein
VVLEVLVVLRWWWDDECGVLHARVARQMRDEINLEESRVEKEL